MNPQIDWRNARMSAIFAVGLRLKEDLTADRQIAMQVPVDQRLTNFGRGVGVLRARRAA